MQKVEYKKLAQNTFHKLQIKIIFKMTIYKNYKKKNYFKIRSISFRLSLILKKIFHKN